MKTNSPFWERYEFTVTHLEENPENPDIDRCSLNRPRLIKMTQEMANSHLKVSISNRITEDYVASSWIASSQKT